MRPVRAFCLSLFGIFMIGASSSRAAIVHIASPDSQLAQSKIRDAKTFVGLMGDFVDLSSGEHVLRIDAPRSYVVIIHVSVDGGGTLAISDFRVESVGCRSPLFDVALDPPRMVQNKSKAKKTRKGEPPASEPKRAVTTLLVNGPRFGVQLPGLSGACAAQMNMRCLNQTMAAVDVTSTPSGAEIWIDDKPTDVITNSTLSVPFCPGKEKTVDISLRLPGRVVCKPSLVLRSEALTSLACNLVEPR